MTTGHARPTAREYNEDERTAIAALASGRGLAEDEVFHRLGSGTYDIHLNTTTFWRNVDRPFEWAAVRSQLDSDHPRVLGPSNERPDDIAS